MHLEHIRINFLKRRDLNGLQFVLMPGATDDRLDAAEARIGHRFPEQVRAFYSTHNGLAVAHPQFAILPVEDLTVDAKQLIHFATANGDTRIAFDCSHVNIADQWDIIESETGYRITHSLASFWTNKMWKWIDRRLAFWQGEV